MKMLVSIDELKQHLNIVDDELTKPEEDYLIRLIKTSESAIQKAINRRFYKHESDDIKMEILILAANLYSNREATTHTSINEVPMTFSFLNMLNRNFNDKKGYR
jgi:uncharacterized phage protein (predicted DNA packaging)